MTKIENGAPRTFPYDSVTGGLTDPPEGYTWDDISYVNGGYGWKARFIDQRGYIITGDQDAATQYNYENEFVDDAEDGFLTMPARKSLMIAVAATRPDTDLKDIRTTWKVSSVPGLLTVFNARLVMDRAIAMRPILMAC